MLVQMVIDANAWILWILITVLSCYGIWESYYAMLTTYEVTMPYICKLLGVVSNESDIS